jgi:hypothetical protein
MLLNQVAFMLGSQVGTPKYGVFKKDTVGNRLLKYLYARV